MSQVLPLPFLFVPGHSFLHRLHPLAKLLWALCALTFAFSTRNPLLLAAFLLVGLLFIACSHAWRAYLRILLVLLPISLSLIVLQAIAPAFPQPWVPITSFGPFTIYQEGIYSGVSLLLRTWVGVTFSALLVLTTHPGDLFAALQRLGMPHEMNFMISTSIQLVPIVQREFALVLAAQRSRGMPATGFAAAVPSIVPVFAGTVERVQQLAMSLESRAFGSKGTKTSLREVRASFKDYAAGLIGLAVTVVATYLAIAYRLYLDWSGTALFAPWVSMALVLGAAVVFLAWMVSLWVFSRR